MRKHWEMRNEEEEELLEAEVPRNPRISQIERNKNMKILDMLSTEVWVGGRLQIELLHEEEREHVTPTVAFNGSFITQKIADTFPLLICRDSRCGQTGATCCEWKGLTAYSISFLCGFIKDFSFRTIILKYDTDRARNHFKNEVFQACVGGRNGLYEK